MDRKKITVNELGYYLATLSPNKKPYTVELTGEINFEKLSLLLNNAPDGIYIDLILPDSITSIDGWSFNCCETLTKITIPDTVTSIGDHAFFLCKNLRQMNLPSSITFIGSDSICGCYKLRKIKIPSSVKNIEKGTFAGCRNLSKITVDEKNTKYDSRDNCNAIIETESNTLLAGCKKTVIPETVTSIGKYAFSCCSRLTQIKIPENVALIGEGAFFGCTNLSEITVDENNTKYDSRNDCNAIIETESNTLITGCMNTVIPDSVTDVAKEAFLYCTKLKQISIPESVVSIGNEAFANCVNLKQVIFSDNLRYIGYEAFRYCKKLSEIKITKDVALISNGTFARCDSLSKITVDKRNTKFDSRENCNAIIETATNTLISGCKSTVIPDTVTSICSNAFQYCKNLTITIPETVTFIGRNAFDECENLSINYKGTDEQWNKITNIRKTDALTEEEKKQLLEELRIWAEKDNLSSDFPF